MEKLYDVIIIGGGPSGLSAAIYSSRAKLKTLLFEKAACGGQIIITDLIENYPGFDDAINGYDFAMKLESQAKKFGTDFAFEEVIEIKDGKTKIVKTAAAQYETKSLIIAAGTKVRPMGIKGEKEFMGQGISYCAVCDAPFFKNKTVAVIGGGDSAVQESIYLSKFAKTVIAIHRRDSFRAAKSLQDKMFSVSNISVKYDCIPLEIKGSQKVESLIISNLKTKEQEEIFLDGIFVFIGLIPNTENFNFLNLENGYIVTDENMQTSAQGIFACGDIRKKQLRQVVTAASDGACAAVSAERCLVN
ncbi:MAG: thioredoxin-disulfide reductase [Elusimicrobiota bacterium]|jgi:thioredoxin reductase (NADPH)|nr:thioredoxin-disulfide reductase [Elusimicrobiota bacterium]